MMIALIANVYINNINVGAILPVSDNMPILYLSQTLYERKYKIVQNQIVSKAFNLVLGSILLNITMVMNITLLINSRP